MITALRWIIGILALVMHEVLQEIGFVVRRVWLRLLAGRKEKQYYGVPHLL